MTEYDENTISRIQRRAAGGGLDYDDQKIAARIITQLSTTMIETQVPDHVRDADLTDKVTAMDEAYNSSVRSMLLVGVAPVFAASLLVFGALFDADGAIPWIAAVLLIASVVGTAWYYHPDGGGRIRPSEALRNKRAAILAQNMHVRRIPTDGGDAPTTDTKAP